MDFAVEILFRLDTIKALMIVAVIELLALFILELVKRGESHQQEEDAP